MRGNLGNLVVFDGPAGIVTLSTIMDDIHTAQGENAAKDDGVKITTAPHPTLEEYERLFGVDEDAYEQPTTTRKELWSYYLYYNGKPFVGGLRSMRY
jgi:hypothetical protein